MEKYLKKISKISSITSIIFIVIGLFLIIKPETTLSLISYVLGIVILINGIMNLVRYFSNRGNGNLSDKIPTICGATDAPKSPPAAINA